MTREDDIDHEEHRAVQQAIRLALIRRRDARWSDSGSLHEAAHRDRRELLRFIDELEQFAESVQAELATLRQAARDRIAAAPSPKGNAPETRLKARRQVKASEGLPSERQEYQFVFGDRVTTTDSSTPEPVVGFRSDTDPTGQARPFILVGAAWYYPHELEIVTLHTREELLRELSTIRECLFSGQKSCAKLVAQGAFQSLALRLGIEWTPPG